MLQKQHPTLLCIKDQHLTPRISLKKRLTHRPTIRIWIISIIIFILGTSKLRVYLLLFLQVSVLRLWCFLQTHIVFWCCIFRYSTSRCYRCSRFLIHAYSHLLLTSNQIAVLVSINQNSITLGQLTCNNQVCYLVNNTTLNQSLQRTSTINRIQTIKSQ